MYKITTLTIITLWPEMNANIFKSLMTIYMTGLFTGLQGKGRGSTMRIQERYLCTVCLILLLYLNQRVWDRWYIYTKL
jgi:hypothetical protein